jgi:hypothetical protein
MLPRTLGQTRLHALICRNRRGLSDIKAGFVQACGNRPSARSAAMLTTFTTRLAAAVVVAIGLAGCVESQNPLITDAKPLLGEQFEVHLYENFIGNKASAFHKAFYQWRNGQYARDSTLSRDARRFAARHLDGNDFIVQSTDETGSSYFYWIGRRLHPGVYLIFPLDEGDATEAVRKAACATEAIQGVCRVSSTEHLVALARATAAKPVRDPALGVVLAR